MPLGTLKNGIKKHQDRVSEHHQKRQILLDICEGGAFCMHLLRKTEQRSSVLHHILKSDVLPVMEERRYAKIADFGLAFLKEFSSDMSQRANLSSTNEETYSIQGLELFFVPSPKFKAR
jgi:hypothetical protein